MTDRRSSDRSVSSRPRMTLHDTTVRRCPRPTPATTPRWAASGAMALTGLAGDGPPRLAPRSLVPFLARRRRGGEHRAAASASDVARHRSPCSASAPRSPASSRHGRRSCGGATELLRSADGWIAVSLARPDDVELLPAWLGTDDVAGRRRPARRRPTSSPPAIELGIPCSRLGEVATSAPAFTTRPLAAGPPAATTPRRARRRPVVAVGRPAVRARC